FRIEPDAGRCARYAALQVALAACNGAFGRQDQKAAGSATNQAIHFLACLGNGENETKADHFI
ncbi:hypothetical protein, partial [Chitinimonas sp.]|uniref:hypothetical protein n=1 Tax=Chitinimonas sp. TaxID=1934313 RepID=UPI0035B0DD93